jgi:hypothetical protein
MPRRPPTALAAVRVGQRRSAQFDLTDTGLFASAPNARSLRPYPQALQAVAKALAAMENEAAESITAKATKPKQITAVPMEPGPDGVFRAAPPPPPTNPDWRPPC